MANPGSLYQQVAHSTLSRQGYDLGGVCRTAPADVRSFRCAAVPT